MIETNKINNQTETAFNYVSHGWHVTPVQYRTKKPILKGWNEIKPDWKDDPNYKLDLHYELRNLSNIGVVLGKASNNLIDIDLDAPESLELAGIFLPNTSAIFGRISNPKSHYLYYCKDAKSMEFEADGMILELRSDGRQTVFPGSIHESGETIEWHESGTPANVEYEDLKRRLAKLASAAYLARFWKGGLRHHIAMALSGALVRRGWTESEIAEFVRAVCIAAKDSQIEDRLRCVADTVEKHKSGESVTGIPELAKLTSRDAVRKICDWLQLEFISENTKLKDAPNEIIRLIDETGISLFRTSTFTPYAKVKVKNHFEVVNIQSENFSRWIRGFWYSLTKKPIRETTLNAVVSVYRARAEFDAPQKEVFIRVAEHDGITYLDLTNETWQVVEIDALGWRVIESVDCPVMFRRTSGMLPLPIPEKGGRIDDLRQYINVTDESFVLVKGWLLGCLKLNIHYPILRLSGGGGSAKTTTSEIIRLIIDPNTALTNTVPDKEGDILIAANNSLVYCVDNISYVKGDLSDIFCRLSTGSGLRKRSLYTNDDETILCACRPVILNGITDFLTNPDIISRTIVAECPTISQEIRKSANQIKADFQAAHPKLLGALLDAAAMAKRGNGFVPIEQRTRMFDFQTWVASGEMVLGLESGEFNRVYSANASDGQRIVESNNPLFQLILKFMADKSEWIGTATELLQQLELFRMTNVVNLPIDEMPKRPDRLSNYLRRFDANLRENGIGFSRGNSGGRTISLRKSSE